MDRAGWLSWRLKRRVGKGFFILTYHRVLPERPDWVEPGMVVRQETLEMHLRFLREHCEVLPLSALFSDAGGERLSNGRQWPVGAVTFDDGWLDFQDHVYPLLKQYGIPATVFLPTDWIGSSGWHWTDRLGYLLSQRRGQRARPINSHRPIHPAVRPLDDLAGSDDETLDRVIRQMKQLKQREIEEILRELEDRWGIDSNPPGRAFLNWDEVRGLRESGLVEFGSHTASHRILTVLSEEEIREELNRSRARLITEQAADENFIPFSYPNGNYNPVVKAMVKQSGYTVAVTTDRGWNSKESDPRALRRISVHDDVSATPGLFGCRLLGLI